MNIAQIATSRRTCKAFDPARKIPAETVEALRTVLRFAPSSVNAQPWHFVMASTEAGKGKVVATLEGGFAYNAPKAQNCSHLVVLCASTELGEAHLANVLEQEDSDGRFATPEAKGGQNTARTFYVGMHRDNKDLDVWIDRQVYIALGTILQAAGALGIDACPMEGFDSAAVDAALGLTEKGLRSVVMVALGYGSEGNFNAKLPKSRLPEAAVFTDI